MVTIRSVEAFVLSVPTTYGKGATTSSARRPSWLETDRVAGSLSNMPRFSEHRDSWRFRGGAVGCVVTASDGSFGFGVSTYGAPVAAIVNDHFAELLEGEDALATARLWDLMMRATRPYGSAGLASYAISAVDLALWDLKGRVLGQPVYTLAGGPLRDDIACYATGNDTDWYMELGFAATKIACPYGTHDGLDGLEKNAEFVARARDTVGDGVELMLDCWLAFDVEFAVRQAERLRPFGLRWIEDCLVPEDLESHAELRRRLPWQGLATGEHWYTPYPFFHAAAHRLADILQPDIAWVGGFTACQRIAHIAEAAGIDVMLHAGMNTPYGQHFTLSQGNARWGECFVGSAPGVPLAPGALYPGMAVPKGGRVAPNDAPGFGHGLTLDAIETLGRRP